MTLFPHVFRPALVLFVVFWAAGASAQFTSEPTGSPDFAARDGIEGHWIGIVQCGPDGWIVRHHVYSEAGALISAMSFTGKTAGTRRLDIFAAGDRYIFDYAEPGRHDYSYVLKDDKLQGEVRGEDCATMLFPVTGAEFDIFASGTN